MVLLTVSKLAFEVRGEKILDGLDLALAGGEIHALVGANGTDKTTLAYLIMGCKGYTPSAGEIRFQDSLINTLPLHERASHLCGGRIIATGEPDAIAERFRTRRCVVCNGEACHG